MNEGSHTSPAALRRCSHVLSSARHRGADGEITGCELCLSLPHLGKVPLPSHCTPWGATRRLVGPPERGLHRLPPLVLVSGCRKPEERCPICDSGRIHQVAGRQEERSGDYPVQRLAASLPETGALSSQNQHVPQHPVATHIQHQGELLAEPRAKPYWVKLWKDPGGIRQYRQYRQYMNPLSRRGYQNGGRASTKLKALLGPLTAALPKPGDCWGRQGGAGGGRAHPGRAEALASDPWLGNNIVPRTRWGQCVEMNKIFIIRENSQSLDE